MKNFIELIKILWYLMHSSQKQCCRRAGPCSDGVSIVTHWVYVGSREICRRFIGAKGSIAIKRWEPMMVTFPELKKLKPGKGNWHSQHYSSITRGQT